jgi:hypothetical protein
MLDGVKERYEVDLGVLKGVLVCPSEIMNFNL